MLIKIYKQNISTMQVNINNIKHQPCLNYLMAFKACLNKKVLLKFRLNADSLKQHVFAPKNNGTINIMHAVI